MTDLLQEIQSAKVTAAENAVLQHLEIMDLDRVDAPSDPTGRHQHAVLLANVMAKNEILFRDTVNAHGFEAQVRQLSEEMAELFVALNHLARGRSTSWRDVADEVGDVYTLLAQVPHIVWSIFDHYDEFVDLDKFSLRVATKVRKNLSALRAGIEENGGEA